MLSFPLSFSFFFFFKLQSTWEMFFFSFQILDVKTQLKPDSTAFYRNTQPSVTLGCRLDRGLIQKGCVSYKGQKVMLPGDQRQQQRVHEAVCRERDKGSSLTIFLDLKHQPPNQPTNPPSNMFNNVEVGQDGAASQGDQESRGSLARASWEASPLRTLTQPGLQICPPLSHSCPFSTSLPFFCQPSWRGSPFGGRSSFSSAGDLVLCTARPAQLLAESSQSLPSL